MAVEPTACPTLTKGSFVYDFGDIAKMTPLLKMYTLGHDFVPAGIHAGGLRYHGAAPLASHLLHHGYLEARAYPQTPVFEAALQFTQAEGHPSRRPSRRTPSARPSTRPSRRAKKDARG